MLPRGRTADYRRHAKQGADDRRRAGAVHLDAHARQMAAGDVARFMGQNADHFIGRLGLHQQAGVDEQALTAGHEGVDARIIDQVDLDRAGIDTGRPENRLGVEPHQAFDFRIADKIRPTAVLRGFGKTRQGAVGGKNHGERGGQEFSQGLSHGITPASIGCD